MSQNLLKINWKVFKMFGNILENFENDLEFEKVGVFLAAVILTVNSTKVNDELMNRYHLYLMNTSCFALMVLLHFSYILVLFFNYSTRTVIFPLQIISKDVALLSLITITKQLGCVLF